MKLKFEEAIAVPDSQRRSVADSIDYHSIGIIYFISVISVYLLSALES